MIAEHYLKQFVKEHGRDPKRLSRDAVAALVAYPWPGNVRELRNVIESIVVFHRGDEVRAADMPPEILAQAGAAASAAGDLAIDPEPYESASTDAVAAAPPDDGPLDDGRQVNDRARAPNFPRGCADRTEFGRRCAKVDAAGLRLADRQRADRSWTKSVSRASWSGSVEGSTPWPRLKMWPDRRAAAASTARAPRAMPSRSASSTAGSRFPCTARS